MAIIIIDIVPSEYEEIKELSKELEMGNLTEEEFKEGLMRILGDALPRGPERDDEIRLQMVKQARVGWTKGSKLVH